MYLVVISYCEDETYFFKSLEDMLYFFKCNSIDEIIKENDSFFAKCYIYKVESVYE